MAKRGHEVHVYTSPFKLLRANADLIHLHANKHFSTDVGALVAKIKNTPLAYSPHAGTFGKSLLGRIHNQTIGRISLSADVVVCVSEYEKGLIEASGVGVRRFEVLPNGVDPSRFKFAERPQRELEESPTVLYVGRLSSHKGLDTLVKAVPLVLEKISGVKFVIAGPDGGEEKSLKLKVKSAKLERDFSFLGEVSEEEKISLMQEASVFVLPSRSEAFGITTVEAMAAGCPVVVSDLPALTEIVTDGRTGLVFPVNDEKLLANRILKLLSDQDLSHQISTNAKAKVSEKYDWEKIIDRLEKIYTQLKVV